jgi:hypothetical protein
MTFARPVTTKVWQVRAILTACTMAGLEKGKKMPNAQAIGEAIQAINMIRAAELAFECVKRGTFAPTEEEVGKAGEVAEDPKE